MGVAREDHVDALHTASHLLVDVKAVVRENDDQLGAHAAHLVDHFLHPLVTDTEGVFREHPARIGDRQIGESLTDNSDLDAAALEELVGSKVFGRFVPLGVENVLAKRRKGEVCNDIANTVATEGEFPVEGHRVGLERVHDVDHVLPLGVVAGIGAVPGVAAVKEESVGTLGADRIDHGRHAVEAAHLAVGAGKGGEVVIGQRIMGRAAIGHAIELAEVGAGDVRHLTDIAANAKVDLGLAEENRFHLRVDIGDVDQGDVTEGIKLQKLILSQGLLGGKPSPGAKT